MAEALGISFLQQVQECAPPFKPRGEAGLDRGVGVIEVTDPRGLIDYMQKAIADAVGGLVMVTREIKSGRLFSCDAWLAAIADRVMNAGVMDGDQLSFPSGSVQIGFDQYYLYRPKNGRAPALSQISFTGPHNKESLFVVATYDPSVGDPGFGPMGRLAQPDKGDSGFPFFAVEVPTEAPARFTFPGLVPSGSNAKGHRQIPTGHGRNRLQANGQSGVLGLEFGFQSPERPPVVGIGKNQIQYAHFGFENRSLDLSNMIPNRFADEDQVLVSCSPEGELTFKAAGEKLGLVVVRFWPIS